ncbi:MAG TPA: hypothetical protein VIU85_05775 [Chthoniobacterales bacterium]
MKLSVPLIVLVFLSGCAYMLEQPYDREKKAKAEREERIAQGQPVEESRPKSSALLEGQSENFTGKVVLDNGAYRFEPLNEPGTLLKLTRARRETEFESGQILLRKYYEKTITVRGMRKDDWIWHADITGQYVPPGGQTGPNMNAPKQTRP